MKRAREWQCCKWHVSGEMLRREGGRRKREREEITTSNICHDINSESADFFSSTRNIQRNFLIMLSSMCWLAAAVSSPSQHLFYDFESIMENGRSCWASIEFFFLFDVNFLSLFTTEEWERERANKFEKICCMSRTSKSWLMSYGQHTSNDKFNF